ncbi:MAG: hypothetical protein FHP92_11585 [Denitromonas halophila]|uniref:Uncharacterized protein n=2 Tax=Denitromonas TaxID=139331 RepID=A0A558EQK5_9RHOO|nr:hypothetical protein FHP90_18160 [Denitromonas ohlonensis]TVO78547.1 hypothetical protein FHP89_04985 [Denitromonas ohlonensis]TVT46482.1 MAG: hypothetical protein FHP94_17060 [Denitromonas halophila]TVT72977.1 MAG: hypothetical protein FHP93_07195 [Denitromonas halophila]TVT75590.1 MAG: hypothetical protein FHP92_11585 [Denitromonas halophila]
MRHDDRHDQRRHEPARRARRPRQSRCRPCHFGRRHRPRPGQPAACATRPNLTHDHCVTKVTDAPHRGAV